MKKISKTFSIIIIVLVILGLILPFSSIFAQENLQAPLKEVSNKVEELIELKDDNTLSEQEKNEKELQVRKEALEKILDLSLIEVSNLKIKLNALQLATDEQKNIKDKFLEILENNESYSNGFYEKIKKENISLEEVKNLAQEYKDWREENYSKYIKKITTFLLTFQEKQVLKTAEIRLEKIMSDLKKLEDLKILKKEDTLKFITASTKNLADAQILNNEAEIKIVKLIKNDLFTEETASSTQEILESKIQEIQPTLMSMKAIDAATTTQEKVISEEDAAQQLIEKSLQEIKNAYNNFIDISNKVSQKLKLK